MRKLRSSVAESFLRLLTCAFIAIILRAMELRVKCVFGPELRDERERRHLTQVEAAAQVGVSHRTWQLWESDEPGTPRATHRRALLAWLQAEEIAA